MKLSDKGFTLMELMIAAAILSIVISGLLSTFINCLLVNQANSNLITAANDAQYILEEMKGLAYSQLSSYTPLNLTNLKNENITLIKNINTSISTITVNVNWTERQSPRNFSLSTRIAR